MVSIADQGKLTGELKEDRGKPGPWWRWTTFICPTVPKRETRASMARGTGTGAPWQTGRLARTQEPLRTRQSPMFQRKRGVDSVSLAIAGAKDILTGGVAESGIPHLWPGRSP